MLLDKYKNNELVPMTRRYPDHLSNKQLRRDAAVVKKMVWAWDYEQNPEKLLSIFLKEKDTLSDERYWETLRTVWILSGKIENIDTFRHLMRSERKAQHWFSTPEENKKYRALPDSFTAYRATNCVMDGGISWTLSYEYAQWYKQSFNKEMIVTREIDKATVFAYIERNKESEIIVL